MIIILGFFLLLLNASSEVNGGYDMPLASRFPGSGIQKFTQTEDQFNFARTGIDPIDRRISYQKVFGKITRRLYALPAGASHQEVAKHFKDEFIKNKLINDLYQINIDLEQTKIWIDKNLDKNDKAYFINSTCCARIANKDIYYSFDNYGRFHTNFTVLKKDIRSNFLKFGKEKIKEIDITNSQPFFLYLLMRNSNFTNFNGFDLDVLSGVIYDKIKNITGINRKEVKTNVYSVLFGRNMSKDYWNDLFNKLYPDVYKWIVDYKKINKSYKIIAHELQRIESDFMFNNLIPRIVAHNKDIRVITIHDSVMVQEKYYNDVKIIFNESLKSLI
jgi:hypothetical protein